MKKRAFYEERVQFGIDFIEQFLDQDIEIGEVAEAACVSQWHFQRMFKALTNETLKTYIRSRRMANALKKLASTDERILDIALATGYETQETFTRAFHLAFGMTPNAYRKIGDLGMFHRKVQINPTYMEQLKMNEQLKPVIYEQEAMNLIGMHAAFYGIDSEKNNAVEKLTPLWKAFEARYEDLDLDEDAVIYGVVGCSDNQGEQLDYYAAVRVEDCGNLPEDLVRINTPASIYARFTHRGRDENIEHTVSYIYGNWLMQSGRLHTYGYDLEIYGTEHDPEAAETVMEYAIPIEPG